MTEVQQATSEVARHLTDRIKVAVEGTWQLITEAYLTRAWSALGYGSWDEYCTREFGTSRLRLPREERADTVVSLREAGLSLRAIAAATGVDHSTISRDLSSGVASHQENATPPTRNVSGGNGQLGLDGKIYPPRTAPVAPAPHIVLRPKPADAHRPDFLSFGFETFADLRKRQVRLLLGLLDVPLEAVVHHRGDVGALLLGLRLRRIPAGIRDPDASSWRLPGRRSARLPHRTTFHQHHFVYGPNLSLTCASALANTGHTGLVCVRTQNGPARWLRHQDRALIQDLQGGRGPK